MNWTRILAATTLTACLLFVASVIWFSDPGSSYRPRLLRGNAVATIIFEKKEPESEKNENVIRDIISHPHAFAWALRSQELTQRVIASFAPNELTRVLGNAFLQTGETPFRGVTVETISTEGTSIRIISEHRDVAAARLVAERLIEEFTIANRELTRTSYEKAVDGLRGRKSELAEEAKLANAALAAMNKDTNPAAYENAERDAKIRQALLRDFENHIAERVASSRKPQPSYFHVSSAQVTSGPFWNRVTTDFTAEAQRLVER